MTQVLTPDAAAVVDTSPVVGGVVGRPRDRIDGPLKVAGKAPYAGDYPVPDLAHAVIVHATVARGRIASIDTSAAETVPGVLAVITHENAPPVNFPKRRGPQFTSFVTDVNYLHTDEVHWDGQAVAMAVADTLAAAEEAASLVRVEYDPITAAVDFVGEQPHAKPARSFPIIAPASEHKGDAEAELAAAPVSVDLTFTMPPYNHNAMEPHCTIAAWDGDRLTVYEATSHITKARTTLAKRFSVPVANVTVIAPYVGGGFGGKSSVFAGTILAPLAARVVDRPVRLALTREGVYRSVGGRPPTVQRVAIGAERDGTITALVHTGVNALGKLGGFPEDMIASTERLYSARAMSVARSVVELDMVPNVPMRAPGSAVGIAALEMAIDEIASELGIDPIEFRLQNTPERTTISDRSIPHTFPEIYALGAKEFGWSSRDPEPCSMRDGRWLVGIGVASAMRESFVASADVTVRFRADGTVLAKCGFQDGGQGTGTVVAQVLADELGVSFDAVEVNYGDSDLPSAPGAFASMHTSSVVKSMVTACEKLRRKIGRLASSADVPGDYVAVLQRTNTPYVEATVGDGRMAHLANAANGYRTLVQDMRRTARCSSGAHFCEVRVDPDTGEVRISRWLGVFDVGRPLNEKLLCSQLRGATVLGIGMGLSEETLVDPRTGRIMNPHLSDYHIPVHADIPHIDIRYLVRPDPTMPVGMYGIGELGTNGAPAAIANAVYHATGRRVYELPITPDKVLGL